MLEGASNLRRGGSTTKTSSLVKGVLRRGRSAKAKILLQRFSIIAKLVVKELVNL